MDRLGIGPKPAQVEIRRTALAPALGPQRACTLSVARTILSSILFLFAICIEFYAGVRFGICVGC